MKILLAILMLSSFAYAECDINPLRNQLKNYYQNLNVPVVGLAKTDMKITDIKTSEYLLLAKYESFIIVTFNLEMNEVSFPLTTIANVDPSTCTLESFSSGDVFGSSIR